MKISDIKANPNNPRIIKDEKFAKLVKSISEFPEMMAKRPMVCVTDTDGKIYPLGGNMRLKALQELKYKDIPNDWVMLADEWSVEKRNEFTIKDNVGFGEWDWDELANSWDSELLTEWGLDIPNFEIEEQDYSDKKKEIDTDFADQKYTFKLEFSEEDYLTLKEKIQEIGKTPESIFYDALISI